MKLFKSRSKSREDTPTGHLFNALKTLGLRPTHIVDVGANHGNWTRTALEAFPEAKVTVFEPLPTLKEKHADLQADPRVTLHYKGVGDTDGVANFTIHSRDDSSSFAYPEEDAKAEGLEQIDVELCRLDTVLAGNTPEIVKIDAEGFDLKVLDGGAQVLSTAEVVLIEAAVANPTFENTVWSVMQRMDALGFHLFDITDLNRMPERRILWLIEAVFVRKGGALHKASQTFV